MTGTLKVSDCRRRDRGERHVVEVLLDDAEPLILEFDRATGALDRVKAPCIRRLSRGGPADRGGSQEWSR